jgi:hypothetical protein
MPTQTGHGELRVFPTLTVRGRSVVGNFAKVIYGGVLAENLRMAMQSNSGSSTRTPDDFWSRVDRSHPDGCWLYIRGGERTPSGHIRIWWKGTKCYAHRVAYVLTHGPIPVDRPIVRHRCDNPACVRPSHICCGSVADNVRDRDERNRRTPFLPRGAAHWSAKLSEDDVREVRALRGRGIPAAVLARRYGVCPSTIHNVWTGRHYPEAAAA